MAARIRVSTEINGVRVRAEELVRRGQIALVNQVHADSNIYAPMLSTDLRNQSAISQDNKSISWNTPYARRHYYNQMVNYSEPGTGPKWDQKAKSIHGASWVNIVKRAMR